MSYFIFIYFTNYLQFIEYLKVAMVMAKLERSRLWQLDKVVTRSKVCFLLVCIFMDKCYICYVCVFIIYIYMHIYVLCIYMLYIYLLCVLYICKEY